MHKYKYLENLKYFKNPPKQSLLNNDIIKTLLDTNFLLDIDTTIYNWRQYSSIPNKAFEIMIDRICTLPEKNIEVDSSNEKIENNTYTTFNNNKEFNLKEAIRYINNSIKTVINISHFPEPRLNALNNIRKYLVELQKHQTDNNNNKKISKKLNFNNFYSNYEMYKKDSPNTYEGLFSMLEIFDKNFSKIPTKNKITLFTDYCFNLVNTGKMNISEDVAISAIREYYNNIKYVNEDFIDNCINNSLNYRLPKEHISSYSTINGLCEVTDKDLDEILLGINEEKHNIKASIKNKINNPKAILDFIKNTANITKSGVKKIIFKLYGNDVDALVNDTPNILGLCRRTISVIGGASISIWVALPILITDMVISNTINIKKADKLIDNLKKEKSKIKKQLTDETKDEEKKKKLMEYNKELDKQINRLKEFSNQKKSEKEKDEEMDSSLDFDIDDISGDDGTVSLEAHDVMMENCEMDFINMVVCLAETASEENTEILIEKSKSIINKTKDNIAKKGFGKKIKKNIKDKKEKISTSIKNKNDEMYKKNKKNITLSKLQVNRIKTKVSDLKHKEAETSRKLDDNVDNLMIKSRQVLQNNRREAIIKGSVIPSFSKCIKTALGLAGTASISPILAGIGAVGALLTSKNINKQQKFMILDEIEIQLKVTNEKIDKAKANGDTKALSDLYKIKAKLKRERNRIDYGKRGKYMRTMDEEK